MPRFTTMPVGSKGSGRKRRRRKAQKGGNFVSDAWNGIRRGATALYDNVIRPGHNYIKDKKLISKALSLVPHPKAQAGAKVADALGYGRPRVVARSGAAGFA